MKQTDLEKQVHTQATSSAYNTLYRKNRVTAETSLMPSVHFRNTVSWRLLLTVYISNRENTRQTFVLIFQLSTN